MSEAVWPTEPSRSIVSNYVSGSCGVVWEHEDQLKRGLPWMEVHI